MVNIILLTDTVVKTYKVCDRSKNILNCDVQRTKLLSAYLELFKGLGLDSIVSPKFSTASYITKFVRGMSNVRGSEIESLHKLCDEKVEALEFLIKENINELTGVPLKELKLRSGVLIACIVRKDKIIIPTGDDFIERGDTVIIVTTATQIKGIKEILR